MTPMEQGSPCDEMGVRWINTFYGMGLALAHSLMPSCEFIQTAHRYARINFEKFVERFARQLNGTLIQILALKG